MRFKDKHRDEIYKLDKTGLSPEAYEVGELVQGVSMPHWKKSQQELTFEVTQHADGKKYFTRWATWRMLFGYPASIKRK